MKTLQVVFTDEEFKRLQKAKKEKKYSNWNTFLLSKCAKGVSVKRNGNKL